MGGVAYCSFCSAPKNKLLILENAIYCKECDKFFTIKKTSFKCPKCKKGNLKLSDFPMPDGSIVFHCGSCKRMCSSEEADKHNQPCKL